MTVRVVAEFGQSHGGSLDVAKRQAKAAAAAGCSYSKWQVFEPEAIASRYARRYWDPALGGSDSQIETFTQNGNLTDDEWRALARFCRDVAHVKFLATPFSLPAVDLLEDIGVSAYKIASGDLTYKHLLKRVAQTCKPVLLSTGAAAIWEVTQALTWLTGGPVTLLACTLSYPTADRDANLARIPFLAKHFGPISGPWVGYSDHTMGVETALAATALGAQVLEKHCRLETIGDVPDDRMAIDPTQLKEYVRLAQLGATLRGSANLVPSEAELPARVGTRRSIYAARDLPAGHPISTHDLAFLRPCPEGALTPADDHQLLGRTLARAIAQGDNIRQEDIA